ncbi:MAG TPA: M13 family metallopeptidase [Terriglobales bacterium]|nr:M13 family metallopeptidase [Terriglobales bacterium]
MKRLVLLLVVLATAFAFSQTSTPKTPTAENTKGMGLDLDALDHTADPCTDFYQFACGNWMKNNPIPPDQARWGSFNKLEDRNLEILRKILEKYSADDPKRDADQQKIGDYYASCMDVPAIDKKGIGVLKPQFDRVAELQNEKQLPELLGYLHHNGVNAIFNFDSGQDFKDATQVIAQADQGGLGLPDRDYYTKTDAKSVKIRADYVKHVQRMFELAGEPAAKAAADAKTVMDIETALAKGSMTLADRRDPEKVYHKMTPAEIDALSPKFSWNEYFVSADVPDVKAINVASPEFFKTVNGLLASVPLNSWKTYLRWQLIHSTAPLLPTAFVDENFNFFGKELTGTTQIKPRWKRCVEFTDGDLGFDLGKFYVEETFGSQGKERTLAMVHALENALHTDIADLSWMTPETKKAAEAKLQLIANKIGYPNKWRDYSKLQIIRGDAMGNSLRANSFDFNRRMNKIGKPVDRQEWEMTPPTVNAYYDPLMNDINFPAGILQPPFYANGVDDAVNFGGIGAVIGHELTHGFDDQGGQFDGHGNLHMWWTPQDYKNFQQRGECIADEYGKFVATDDVHLNGKLTEGENIADNGGLRLALMALLTTIGDKPQEKIDGFTPEQRLFLSWGRVWCQNERPEELRHLATVDPHSPGRYRVNGVVRNMPEFQKAWGCKAGAAMAPENACRVW